MRKRAAIAGVLVVLVASSFGQQSRLEYDPGKSKQAGQLKPSFMDFTLHRFNPSDKDYGQCFDEVRLLLIEETIRNGYFWSNAVSLSLATCLFLIALYQRRQAVQREWSVSEVLQQYECALARANAYIDAASFRNKELTEALFLTTEPRGYSSHSSVDLPEPAVNLGGKKPADPPQAKPDVRTPTETICPVKSNGTGVDLTHQMGLFKPEIDLVLKVNSLEQQLHRSQEQQKQLRRQLTQADQRLQTEQQKNRTLKGA